MLHVETLFVEKLCPLMAIDKLQVTLLQSNESDAVFCPTN